MRAPSAIGVGASVFAQDKKGFWYRAKVIAERGEKTREFQVKFSGFPSTHNEWVQLARLRQKASKQQIVQLNTSALFSTIQGFNAEQGSWKVDKIVGKRYVRSGGVRYRVRWEGFDESWDTWEPKENFGAGIVEEYDAMQSETEERGRARAVPESRGPFVLEATKESNQELRREHADVTYLLDVVARAAVEAVAAPGRKEACRRVLKRISVAPWMFVDMNLPLFFLPSV